MRPIARCLFLALLLVAAAGCDTLEDLNPFNNEKEVEGIVEAVGDDALTVDGIEYTVTEDTEFEGFEALDDLAVGDAVEIEYEETSRGRVALEIERAGDAEDDGSADFTMLDPALCAPDQHTFTLEIDNPFYPLEVGQKWILEGEEDGELVRVETTVEDATEVVAGVTTRVVEEFETEDGELVEVSHNFFAQTEAGTVCYFGEDVDDYEDGEIVGHDGAWRAGEADNAPGIIMPADPAVGTRFLLEFAPGIAEDRVAVIARGETVTVPFGTFEQTLRVIEWNPLEGDAMDDGDEKVYAPGVGLIIDGPAELIDR